MEDSNGGLWGRILPYTAFWVYNRHDFAAFVADKGCAWTRGAPGYDNRASAAMGWTLLGGGYQHTLAPLTRSVTGGLQVHPLSAVWHVSNRYITEAGGKPFSGPFTVPEGGIIEWEVPPPEKVPLWSLYESDSSLVVIQMCPIF